MPIYVAQCPTCECTQDYVQTVEKHADAPRCDCCGAQMTQILTPVRGFVDIPAYISPASGRVIRGRAARREDLKRTNCRPWEGREAEEKEAARYRKEAEERLDKKITEELSASYESMSQESKMALEHLSVDVTTERG